MESAAASHAGGLVTRLEQLVAAEFRLLSGVRGEVDRLRDEVAIINADLRRLSEADESAVDHSVREWMKQARELAYDAEDCIDLFFFLRISLAPPRAGALRRAWRWFFTIRPRARHRLAIDIQDALARAGPLAIRLHDRNFVVDTALPRSVWFVPASTTPSTALSKLVGVDDQVQHLSDLVKSDQKLTSDNQRDVSLKVFCIVGFAGLGKTTLAMEVCKSLEEEFHCQAMVSVSQVFDAGKDLGRLLKQIIKKVVRVTRDHRGRGLQEEQELRSIDEDDVDELAMMLGDRLDGKRLAVFRTRNFDLINKEKKSRQLINCKTDLIRYLIVIDDVWSISAWEAIMSRMPDNKCSSRIIVTTRIEHVARACSSASLEEEYYIHRVKPLQFQDAKKLFINAVFGPQQYCPEHLVEIMHKILTRCNGLPLAIVCIGRLLAGYRSSEGIEIWTRVSNSISSEMENNSTLEGMRQIITLSYNHLPHHLRACMMYLSIFPEDYTIGKNRLLYRWIAEGLVSEQRGLTIMEVAEAYFDELVSRNMIQPPRVEPYGRTVSCQVHDMMLDIVISKALESNFVSLVDGQCQGTSYGRVRRLSIQSDDIGSAIDYTKFSHIRSLTTFRPKGHRKLLDKLAKFTLLRVLDLQDCKDLQNHHMKHVCQLFLLRFLGLSGTDITELPSQINKLRHLQTLWLFNTLLDKVPESLVDLEKLERVGFSNRCNSKILLRLPRQIRKMKALQRIYSFELREDDTQLAKEIGDLAQLRVLGVILNCSNCSHKQVLTELAKSIDRCSLHELFLDDMNFQANNMNFLLELPSPPKSLRVLYIRGIIDRIPGWVQSLTHLILIELWWINLHSNEIYGVLYKLPSLSKIILGRRCCSDDKLVASTAFKFPLLRELFLFPNEGTPRVFGFEKGAMPKLETLVMNFHGEGSILDGIKHLKSLKEVRLYGWKNYNSQRSVVDQLKAESLSRQKLHQFKVIVTYNDLSAAASHAGGLVARLGQLVTAEFRLLSGVRGEVDRLKDEVAIMNSVLLPLSEVEEGAVDHFVREWMNQVRELAYDAEDCIDLFLLRVSHAPPRAGALRHGWRRLVTIGPRHRLAGDIRKLLARALAISERRVRYDIDGQALPRSVWFVPASTTVPSTAHALRPSKLVGIDDQVQHLSDLVKSERLTCDNQPDVGLKVFCIVGFAGLGKTTLAMEVCRSLEEEFACQAMVPVSQVFDAGKDLGRLLKQIIKKVVRVTSGRGLQEEQELRNIDEDDVDELAMMLGDCLDGKRYLIVIDDVWSISAWEAILSRLPDNKCNSRIIVATRIEHVARACSSASLEEEYYIHRVKPLQFEDAKKLFINAVFGPQQDCPEHLKDIMHKILTRCSGLPLAIVCIGRLLAGYRSPEGAVEMWTRVCNSTGSLMENNPTLDGMRHIMTLSYNHLPHHLRACMMYLSLFPEDYVVDKHRLLYRWIAEGLVSEQRGLTPMEVAESYFAELVNRHMIQPSCTETLGTLMGCRVHDMMLDIIVCKALESNFVSFVGGQCRDPSYGSVRRLAIQSDDLGSSIENTNLRHVRSLTTFRPQGHRKLLDRLAEFTLLRVLDLQDCKDLQNKHMKHVCQLFLLRFLSLNGTDITKLPSQINKLQHLQALWLIGQFIRPFFCGMD
uniref:AAA+ ATPase domain-containing protein n=1 Tax=Oryza glumipatula TaxID=40148 RepID=A0A0E0AGY3_9ORYZ